LAPTNDPDQILPAIKRLSPQNGTSLANGIFASLNTIAVADAEPPPSRYTNLTPAPLPAPTAVPEGTFTSAAIVLLTDGENNENPDPLEAAQAAADRGVRIHTVGIGSAAGTILNLDGFSVHTRLDEAQLQQISRLTGGDYYNAQDEEELRAIYESLDTEFALRPEKMEVTALFAGASILLLLLGGTFSLLWFGRAP
jgi:Ca-activated chloride channel family protein